MLQFVYESFRKREELSGGRAELPCVGSTPVPPLHQEFAQQKIPIRDIFYSQETISDRFCDGRPVIETLADLIRKRTKVTDIPCIRVVCYEGKHYSLDNRRLWVMKHALPTSENILVRMCSLTAEFRWKFTSRDNGTSVRFCNISYPAECGSDATGNYFAGNGSTGTRPSITCDQTRTSVVLNHAALTLYGKPEFSVFLRPSEIVWNARMQTYDTLRKAISQIREVANVVFGGSVAKSTALDGKISDVDIVVMFENFTIQDHRSLLKTLEHALSGSIRSLRKKRAYFSDGVNLQIADEGYTENQTLGAELDNHINYLSGKLNGVRFDVLIGSAQVSRMADDERSSFMRAVPPRERHYWSPSMCTIQVDFVHGQPDYVKDAIRLAKWWCKGALSGWAARSCPRSYLLELLVIYVHRMNGLSCLASELFEHFLITLKQWKNLRITWHWGAWDPRGTLDHKARPVILDFANPTNNVALSLQPDMWPILEQLADDSLKEIQMVDFKSNDSTHAPSESESECESNYESSDHDY